MSDEEKKDAADTSGTGDGKDGAGAGSDLRHKMCVIGKLNAFEKS